MSNTDIITGQYVRIRQTAASLDDRFSAMTTDILLIGVYVFLTTSAMSLIPEKLANFVLIAFIIVPCLSYPLICEYFFRGQSIGKFFCHMRVISADGTRPTIGQLLLRWVFLWVDIGVLCIGVLPILLTARHQRFGDMAAGTMVIKEESYKKWHEALDDFYYLSPNYRPVYPQAMQLSDGQADLIRRTLYAPAGYDEGQVSRLAGKVSRFLQVNPTGDKAQFLTTILNDYQYYTLH